MKTTAGHTVRVIEGDAGGIVARGDEIVDLGEQMIAASDLLREISDGASVQAGKSIEKIRDEVGDVHEELALAGARYTPSGTVFQTYGRQLASIQEAMRKIVSDAEDAQQEVDRSRRAAAQAQAAADDAPEPEPDDTAAVAANEELATAASTASTDLETAEGALTVQFTLFDRQWDAWDAAYDIALNGIEDATDGNISDHWTDNVAGVVEVVLKVLSWVGVALTIAALVIGGPIIAAIAAVVGIIALIGTIYLFMKGRMSGGDLAWAIVGALPFGKLGSLFKSGTKLGVFKDSIKFLSGPFADGIDSVRRIGSLRGLRAGAFEAGRAGLSGRAAAGYADNVAARFGYFAGRGGGVSGVWTRITHGSSAPFAASLDDGLGQFSQYQRRILSGQLSGTDIGDLMSAAPPSTLTQVLNVGDFAFDRSRQVQARAGDISSMFANDPVGQWRSELPR